MINFKSLRISQFKYLTNRVNPEYQRLAIGNARARAFLSIFYSTDYNKNISLQHTFARIYCIVISDILYFVGEKELCFIQSVSCLESHMWLMPTILPQFSFNPYSFRLKCRDAAKTVRARTWQTHTPFSPSRYIHILLAETRLMHVGILVYYDRYSTIE